MKKTAIALGFICLTVPNSSAFADVSENRDLDAFTRVEVDGLMDVRILVGKEQSFTITANKEKYIKDTETKVRGGTLRVDMDVDDGFFSFFKEVKVRIDITVPSLEGLEMNGLGDVVIENVDAEDFEVVLDGMGSVDIDGRCKNARMVIDGMGNLNARDFKCDRIRLTLDGMGDAEVYASDYIYVNLDGFGDVDVYGGPKDRELVEDGMGDVDFH